MMSGNEPQKSDDGAHKGTNDETVLMVEPPSTNPTTTPTNHDTVINGCSMNDGALILFATDEWFASADHLLLDTSPTFDPTAYCSQGKVMDGWETQRKRQLGHDFCLIQLSQRLVNITAVDIDTAYFTGNQTPYVSIWACDLSHPAEEIEFLQSIPNITPRLVLQMKRQQIRLRRERTGNDEKNDPDILPVDEYRGTYATPESIPTVNALTTCHDNNNNNNKWYELLPVSPLRPGYESTRYHHFTIQGHAAATHIRFNYYPDGGVARLRIYGTPDARMTTTTTTLPRALVRPVTTTSSILPYTNDNEDVEAMDADHNTYPNNVNISNDIIVEVSGIRQGGRGIFASNQHYGTPQQLLSLHSGQDMGDGWETARQPTRPQILLPLAAAAVAVAVSNQTPHDDMTTTNDKNVPPPLVDFGHLMEYCVLKLGYPISHIQSIIIDTKHFKGNYPESVELAGCWIAPTNDDTVIDWTHDDTTMMHWYPILYRSRLSPHARHVYAAHQLQQPRAADTRISHVRVRIFPDGGLSRVRIYTTTQRPDDNGDTPTTLSVRS